VKGRGLFTGRPDEERPVEARLTARQHVHALLDEAAADLANGLDKCAVTHLAQAHYVRARQDGDMEGMRRAKRVIAATGPEGLRP
jgi:hypothetical protein